MIMLFTGVFRTTCVTEEQDEEVGTMQKPRTKLIFYIIKYGPNNTKEVKLMNQKERHSSKNAVDVADIEEPMDQLPQATPLSESQQVTTVSIKLVIDS